MSDRSAAYQAVDREYRRRQVKAAKLPDEAAVLVIDNTRDQFDTWLDRAATLQFVDADNLDDSDVLQAMGNNSLDAILLRDALWQCKNPAAFFERVQETLKPGGRLILLEPGVTAVSWLFYSLGPDARMNFEIDPLASDQRPVRNLARPSILFTKMEHRIAFMERFPALHVTEQRWISMLAGPLSAIRGRFSVIPKGAVKGLLDVEDMLSPFLARWLSFRLFIVIEKRIKS